MASASSLVAVGGAVIGSPRRFLGKKSLKIKRNVSETPVDLSESIDFLKALESPPKILQTDTPTMTSSLKEKPVTSLIKVLNDERVTSCSDKSANQLGNALVKQSDQPHASLYTNRNLDSNLRLDKPTDQSQSPLHKSPHNQLPARLHPGPSPLRQSGLPLVMASSVLVNHRRNERHQCKGLVISGIDKKTYYKEIVEFARKFGFKLENSFSDVTSHVVVQDVTHDKQELICDRTLKYFLGIAARCWVVSFQWILDSLDGHFLEPEDSYEICGDTVVGMSQGPWKSRNMNQKQLLADYEICCYGKFSNISLEDICTMVGLCGGRTITDKTHFKHETSNTGRRLILAECARDHTRSHFVAMRNEYEMPVVSREWLLDSVSKYQLQKLKDYALWLPGTK